MKTLKSKVFDSLNFKILAVAVVAVAIMGCGKGPQGPQGPAGVTAASSSGKITSVINCSGNISGLTGQAGIDLNGLYLEYQAALTSAGDVYAAARVVDGSAQYGTTKFYAASQSGASTASVNIVADYDTTSDSGTWTIQLNRNTLVTTAYYTDPSLNGGSSVTMTFLPSACTVTNF